jgi:hypothetical protein
MYFMVPPCFRVGAESGSLADLRKVMPVSSDWLDLSLPILSWLLTKMLSAYAESIGPHCHPARCLGQASQQL